MTKRLQLAALALAAALTIGGGTSLRADNHDAKSSTDHLVGPKYRQFLRNMSDGQLRSQIRDIKVSIGERSNSVLRAQLRAATQEQERRLAGVTKPSSSTTASTGEKKARRLLIGAVEAKALRTAPLQARIKTARQLLRADDLRDRTRNKLTTLLAGDRAELQRRRTATQKVPQAERQARKLLKGPPSLKMRTKALRERVTSARQLIATKKLTARTASRLKQMLAVDRTVLQSREANQQTTASGTERQARDLLAASASSSKLTGRALRKRIKDVRSLLQEPDITRQTRIALKTRLDGDQAELRARRARQGQSGDADQQAKDLLDDNRSAVNLDEPRLKRRLRETRDVLQDPQLSNRYSRRLRARLREDRRELRRRIEARRLGGGGIIVAIEPGNEASGVLSDRRSSGALQTRQLSQRIRRAQRVVNRGGLNSYDRSTLTRMITSDRRELRQRLRTRRDKRRVELDRRRRNNEINIVIAPRIEFAPRDDVAAAEADDDVIERQLVAPPTRQIDRRYSFDEYRTRPELRQYMPAVEVDSIHFGFNEHFVREEEIDELERIGAVIERVIAANPGEVFLIEGHTDAVGSQSYNLSLSTKRADAVRTALIEFFVIAPANLQTIGYGEQFLKIPTQEDEQENRRVSLRRITPLLSSR